MVSIIYHNHLKRFHVWVFDNIQNRIRKFIIKVPVGFANFIDFVANLTDDIIKCMINHDIEWF